MACVSVALLLATLRVSGADPVLLRWDRRQQIVGATIPVFSADAARETALLRIGRVRGRYGKQGVLRVAWRREAYLEDVVLEVRDSSDWPRIAEAVVCAVRELGRAGTARVRRFTLRQCDGERTVVNAAEAELLPDGDLLLQSVAIRRGDGPVTEANDYVLHLSAPESALAVLLAGAQPSTP